MSSCSTPLRERLLDFVEGIGAIAYMKDTKTVKSYVFDIFIHTAIAKTRPLASYIRCVGWSGGGLKKERKSNVASNRI